ncbi:MAG: hypothetical protein KAI25_00015, partial [Hyphomicrobiaceae bacterium]|nr:hypothetical protein [Hyphomicrobiaceae bacterium]
FNHQFGILNGMTRDNVLNSLIETEKIRTNTFNKIKRVKKSNSQFVIRETSSRSQTWLDIPDLSFTLATDDGRLKVRLELSGVVHRGDGSTPGPAAAGQVHSESAFALGIMVDNRLVARTDVNGTLAREAMSVTAAVPVGAGNHDIRGVMRIAPTEGVPPGDNRNVECLGRILWTRYQRR